MVPGGVGDGGQPGPPFAPSHDHAGHDQRGAAGGGGEGEGAEGDRAGAGQADLVVHLGVFEEFGEPPRGSGETGDVGGRGPLGGGFGVEPRRLTPADDAFVSGQPGQGSPLRQPPDEAVRAIAQGDGADEQFRWGQRGVHRDRV